MCNNCLQVYRTISPRARTTATTKKQKQPNKLTLESNFESLDQRTRLLGEQAPLFLLSGLPPAKDKMFFVVVFPLYLSVAAMDDN